MTNWRRCCEGEVLGKPWHILHPMRQSCAEVPQDDVLVWNGMALKLDMRNMQPRLTRLVPSGYLTPSATPNKWEEFVREALAAGLFTNGNGTKEFHFWIKYIRGGSYHTVTIKARDSVDALNKLPECLDWDFKSRAVKV